MLKKIIKTLDSNVKNILDSVQYSTVQYSTGQNLSREGVQLFSCTSSMEGGKA